MYSGPHLSPTVKGKTNARGEKIKPNRVCEKEILTFCRKGENINFEGRGREEYGFWTDICIDRYSEVNFLNFSTK